ncbi:GAF domain-containing protein [Odoribacter lunatus]|uniref:GAF domain-containing protein n=1 Tax=Odoribacter lunatus TaxID=2941335 RepID=UPI00203FCAE9|nr:GAF domain-containing protein [Odoribacter lunatus]
MNTISAKEISMNLSDVEFLSHLNIRLTSNHNYHNNIEEALGLVGKKFGYDRIHIIKIYPDRTFNILHEWCDCHVPTIKKQVKKIPCFFDPLLEQQLNEKAYILINNPEQLHNPELKQFYCKYSTINVLFLPLLLRNFFAFLSLSMCRHEKNWSEKEIHFMSLIASVIAANIEKNLLIAHLSHRLKN